MLQVIHNEGKFLAKGTFSFGMAGVFQNHSFHDEVITIHETLDHLLAKILDMDESYLPLHPYLAARGTDGNAIAQGLEAYYNHREADLQIHCKEVNDCILLNLFEDLVNHTAPFWQVSNAVLPGSLDGYDLNTLTKTLYTDEVDDTVCIWTDEFFEQPNNGTVEKSDIDAGLRKLFPMFNFDGLYQSIHPDSLTFCGDRICVQFSDTWGGDLLGAAGGSFDDTLTAWDWHNH